MKKRAIALLLLLALLLGGCQLPTMEAQPVEIDEGLTVWYVDVGQADCALLGSRGEYMLIDGGNVDDGSLVVTFLQNQGVETLKAVVCTHAHEDHVGGLAAVLAVFPTEAVYAPTRTYASRCFDDFMYYVDQQRLEVTIPQPGDSFRLGDADITILGPVKSYPETNDTSIVLRADCGEVGFLFTGDMETDAEEDLIRSGAELSAQVLKVGHHGSSTSTGASFLAAVDPEYGIISCGKGNTYGHPHRETLAAFGYRDTMLLRTDELGTIQGVCDGKTVVFTWENRQGVPSQGEAAGTFIGNVNSKIFHREDCGSLPAEKNQIIFDSYEDALAAGYSPHKGCLG